MLIAFSSYFLANTPFFRALHLSPLILSILLGIFCIPLFSASKELTQNAISFSAKKLLRLGIILFGFNITLENILFVGVNGILLSLFIVFGILILGYFIGVKFLKMDKEIALLVSGGSAICGAAAILALESSLKSKPYKSAIAVGVIVVFGLVGMFLHPLIYALGILPFDFAQEGFFVGLTLHELANVVGAGGAISQETQEISLIIKMIRVLLLIVVLLILPFFVSSKEGEKRHLHIPYFAFYFLAVVLLNSFFVLPESLLKILRFSSNFLLVMAMGAIGLQVDLKKFVELGGKAFLLGLILFGILIFGGFVLVYYCV